MPDNRSRAGFTLIELLLVMLVVLITLQFGGASFATMVADMRSASAIRHVQRLLSFARHEAIHRQQLVTVCAVTQSGRCTRDWIANSTIAVFIDVNENRRLEPSDHLLRRISWPVTQGELSWRASLARGYITFEEAGNTWQNGTLYYCPASRDARQARALVLSHSGRSYLPGDSNGDGIRENRSQVNLSC